jgi:hypothetical protein
MSRPKKVYKRINIRLAKDAADLLEQYCHYTRYELTFAIENIIRLHVPILLGKQQKKDAQSAKKASS